MKTNIQFCSYIVRFFLQWENFSDIFPEKFKIHASCTMWNFRKLCMYEIICSNNICEHRPQMCNNIMWPHRPQMTVRPILVSCWTKKINSNAIGILNIYFNFQQFSLKPVQILRYNFTVHLEFNACCVGRGICRWRSLFHGDFNGCVYVFVCVSVCVCVCV